MHFKHWLALGVLAAALAGCAGGGAPARMPAQPQSKTGTAAPPASIRTAWDEQPLALPPPIDVAGTIFTRAEYRRWQFGGGSESLTLKDADGGSTQVRLVGAKGKGRASSSLAVTRRRPDGSLENETLCRPDGSLDAWTAYAADGRSRLVRVQMQRPEFRPDGRPAIRHVNFYEPERIRQLQVGSAGVAWQELVVREDGSVVTLLRQDPAHADQLKRLGRK